VFDRAVLRFEYEAVGLPDLDAEHYLDLDNPLASALSALMRPGPTGRLAQKLQSLRRVLLSDIDEARKSLLVNTIETYLPMSGSEALQFEALLGQEEAEEAREMLTVLKSEESSKESSRASRTCCYGNCVVSSGCCRKTIVAIGIVLRVLDMT